MTTMNLEAKRHDSRVLSTWADSRPGASERMGHVVRNATVSTSDGDGLRELFQPIASSSGYAVTDKTAMLVSTVYACLRVIGGAVLQLPINKYRENEDGDRSKYPRDNLWYLLNESPSPAWTASSWMEWVTRCVHLRGDQHTEIVRSKRASNYGEPIGFKIHHPDYSHARRVGDRLVYDVMDIANGNVYTVDQDDMLHFAGFGFDGLRSLSVIQYAAKMGIGNALAAGDYTGRSIGDGAMPQIALSYANKMSPDQAKMLRESFVATYGSGSNGNGRKLPLILTEGGTAKELSISPIDLQLLESRRFEREDICQAIGTPPILIGDSDKTSSWGTGIEQITLGFVKYTMKPHLTRWSEEMNRKLFRNAGPFLEFDLDELLVGDSKARADADRAALGGPGSGSGWKTQNEVRRSRNLPPKQGGDELFKAETKAAASAPANPPKENNGNE